MTTEMTLDEARAYVINKFNYIEMIIELLITKEIQPREDRVTFVKEILLNTAIISASGKFKLIRHIIKLNKWAKIDEKHFHRLLNIRNQFAHARGRMHLTANIIQNETGEDQVMGEVKLLLGSLDNQGELKPVDYIDALSEFNIHYSKLRTYLHNIRDLNSEPVG